MSLVNPRSFSGGMFAPSAPPGTMMVRANGGQQKGFTSGVLAEYPHFMITTFQSMINAKLSPHGFWHCHENRLIKTIQTIPHNLYVSFKLTFLYCGLRIILVYPNPQ